jgi:hypothetical protein
MAEGVHGGAAGGRDAGALLPARTQSGGRGAGDAARRRAWALRDISVEEPRLEDVFVELTRRA